MKREEIKNKVIEIIADKICLSQSEIKESSNFKYDLGTDSLDDIQLLIEFEGEFGIKILDEEMLTVCTVGEAIDGICQKLGVSICKQQRPEMDKDFFFNEVLKVYDDNNKYPPRSEEELTMLEAIARHFYELGLNARKEE